MSCYRYIDADTKSSINHLEENIIIMELAMRRFKGGYLEEAGIVTLKRLIEDTKTEVDYVESYADKEMESLYETIQEKDKEINRLKRDLCDLMRMNEEAEFEKKANQKGYIKVQKEVI